MKKALVLTRCWSEEPEKATHGIFLRFSLFLDALCAHVDAIEILTFAPVSEGMVGLAQRHAAHFQTGRSARITVTAVARSPNPANWSFLARYLKPALWVDQQENFLNIATDHCVEAVRTALSGDPPALVFAHRLPVFTALFPALGTLSIPVLFDMDDIEHRALSRALLQAPRWPSDRLRLLHIPALITREKAAIRASVNTFVCSSADANYLRKLADRDNVIAVPNSVSAPARLPATKQAGHNLGFIGSFQHAPNIDAAQWLIEEIWPRIHAQLPDAKLMIAGAGSRAALDRHINKPGIEILDFVNQLADFYSNLDLMLAPLRFGAGTRIKIIEAAGFGLATVSTDAGAEGLEMRDGIEIAIANKSSTIADLAVQLLRDKTAGPMGQKARQCYEQYYSRDKAVALIAAHIEKALSTVAQP